MLYTEDRTPTEPAENKPNAYRVDDDKDTQDTDTAPKAAKPVREGQPMGGENFGANNVTPAGDDKNNPSQNAGYSNAYFKRTEPTEEHTESNNFTPQDQEGRSDYSKATAKAPEGEGDDSEESGDAPKPKQGYEEGTADNDGKSNGEPNIPGPNEVPDQQKVGE